MRRRFFVIALAAAACAPTGPTQGNRTSGAAPNPLPPGKPLLAMGYWSAPVSQWSQWLAVYEDGLLELRWYESAEREDNPFAMELRARTLRVAPKELGTLRASLSAKAFRTAKSNFHEPGVHDGGALTIADMATHRRRIIVVNRPSKLPRPVADTKDTLTSLAKRTKESGVDAFAQGPDRIELVYIFSRGEENRHLTVYESGLLEHRTVHTTSDKAHRAHDYPTPYAVTRQADARDLEDLRATLAALPAEPPKVLAAERTSDTFLFGSPARVFHVPTQPSVEVIAVESALEALINVLEDG